MRIQLAAVLLLISSGAAVRAQTPIPFSTDSTHITVWNGERHVPFFVKGVNLGVGIPGTFPGEMAATREQYRRWFGQIREAGFNVIRVYTLHFPRFYEELRAFNLANPRQPLILMHGVWLEEEVPGYDHDLFGLTDRFDQEMRENVGAVHGDIQIAPRVGKAFGTYTADVSAWTMAYIIGREVMPEEVVTTDERHAEVTAYTGTYLSIAGTEATEAWFVERMDRLIGHEWTTYGTMRPVSFSSWPTLDPFDHPEEWNENEDLVGLDISGLDHSRAPAGVFASYHIYPYYPDFISRDSDYQNRYDAYGPNSYLAYLEAMKGHYAGMPFLVAEYGAPSSWGIAHYAQNGIHHGGHDERQQGEAAIRLLENTVEAGTGGGMVFAWIDEWFKRTWVADPYDFLAERRIIWHNVTSAEQNYGLIGFRKTGDFMSRLVTNAPTDRIRHIDAGADFAYLHLRFGLGATFGLLDTLWVALDTYDPDLGESRMPDGTVMPTRAEFLLRITHSSADLFVTQAYDTYGIWHRTSAAHQRYQSIPTDGAPWLPVRWKNNIGDTEAQYIGVMRVNRLGIPPSSHDAVRISDNGLDVRLPWTLMHVVDPSQRVVLHDDRATPDPETRVSDGLGLFIRYGDTTYQAGRYLWPTWNHALDAEEYVKDSYHIFRERQPLLPGNPVAVRDSHTVAIGTETRIAADAGVLANDWAAGGGDLSAILDRPTANGLLQLAADGGFRYRPVYGFAGTDTFTYRVKAGMHVSEAVSVVLRVSGDAQGDGFAKVYPNPSAGPVTVESRSIIDHIEIFTLDGRSLGRHPGGALQVTLDWPGAAGSYFLVVRSGSESLVRRVTRLRAH